MASNRYCKCLSSLCPFQSAVSPARAIPWVQSVGSLTLCPIIRVCCFKMLNERLKKGVLHRCQNNRKLGTLTCSTNSISLVGNWWSFTTIIAIMTHFTSKMDVKHYGNLFFIKIYCTIMGAGASHHYSVRPKHQLRKYWIYCLWHAA